MGLKEIEDKLNSIDNSFRDEELQRVKKKEFKLPFGIRMKTKRAVKKGKFLCVYLRNNKRMEFRIVDVFGGLIKVDKYELFAYESDAVYNYKKFPVIVIFEWRLLPVGGGIDEYLARILGGKEEQDKAKELNIKTDGQQTIIRSIEKAEKNVEDNKKKGLSMFLWIIIIGVGGYLIAKMMGLI